MKYVSKMLGCLFTFFLFSASAAYANWIAETPINVARDQFTGGVIDGKIYVFGGNGDPDGFNLKSCEVFDPATRIWSFCASNEHNDGRGVEELTGAVVNGKLYVFGAWGGGTPYGVFNFIEEYDTEKNLWTSKAPMPTTRSGVTSVVYAGEIYLFGGYYGNELGSRIDYNVVEAYNPSTNTWRFVTNMPKTLASFGIAVSGDKAYVFGGYSYTEDKLLSDVVAYDFQTGEWLTTGFTPMPSPKVFSYASAAPVIDGKVYLVGGVRGKNKQSHWIAKDVMIYDTLTNTWSMGPSLPQPSASNLVTALSDVIYSISGVKRWGDKSADDIRTNAVWKLPPPIELLTPSAWEIVPSGTSYDITWEPFPEAERFKLLLSTDNKLTWKSITKAASGTSYPWSVPVSKKNKKAHIKIIGYNASGKKVGTDISDSYFIIETVSILSPNGGESLPSGVPVDITWRTTPTPKAPVASYNLYYSTNNGRKWTWIASEDGNPGTYPWTPYVKKQKKNCRLKIVLKDADGHVVGTDISDAVFTITP